MSRSFGDTVSDMHLKNQHTVAIERRRLIREFDCLPVFVDGQEQTGRCHNRLLQNMPRYGVGMTQQAAFSMNMNTSRLYPVSLYEGEEMDHCGKLSGEVFLVTPDVLFDLDRVYMNGTYFHRVKRAIVHTDPGLAPQIRKKRVSMCYMYLGIKDYWQGKRANGDLKLMEPYTGNDGGLYYNYSLEDDKDAIPF